MLTNTPENFAFTSLSAEQLNRFPLIFYCDNANEVPLYQRIIQKSIPKIAISYKGNHLEKLQELFREKNAAAFMTKSLTAYNFSNFSIHLVDYADNIIIATTLLVKSTIIQYPYVHDLIHVFQSFFSQYQ